MLLPSRRRRRRRPPVWLAPLGAALVAVGGALARRRRAGGPTAAADAGSAAAPPETWTCACGQEYRVSGIGRHRVFWPAGADEGDPVMTGRCPSCERPLPDQLPEDER